MSEFVQRTSFLQSIRQGLEEFPVVALLGARQVGKTTLSRQLTTLWKEPTTLFDLERRTDRVALTSTPELLLNNSTGLIIVDEIQRQPELFTILRPICDDPNRQARFLLLGSASPDLIQGVSETLAGRIRFIEVSGFSLDEIGEDNQNRLWFRGGFPRSYLSEDDGAARRWLEAFTRTYLERDILAIDPRVSPTLVDRFWRMLAHRHACSWNASEIGGSLGVGTREVNRFRDLLLGSFMIRSLPAWYENIGKRLIKSPKIYLRDSGILHFLLGLSTFSDLSTHPSFGASWEGFALEQLLVAHGERDAYYYRTQRGTELDLLLLRKGKRWGFEFKCSDAPRTTKAMQVAINDLNLEHLWVVYPGTQSFPLTESITALPLRDCSRLHF
ncbi:MAG: ATP-binding protein [Gammaproteobacteria bacterium]|nr:ATP-binding protein [Gammaproteobacteria bacterium]MYF39190.1 ATP-binding protein [Gammaproteobacteria bacterium]